MPEDQLTHDFYRSAGPGSIGGRMPTQIVGCDLDSDDGTGFPHNHPCGRIGDRKNPLIGFDAFFHDIGSEPVGDFLGDVDHLGFLSALRADEKSPSILDVPASQAEDFPDAHTASGHQFQD